jgi:hypothetical protein
LIRILDKLDKDITYYIKEIKWKQKSKQKQ